MATAPQAPQGKALSPQQMQAYKLIVKQAMEFLLQKEHASVIVQKAEQGDPKQAVVDAIAPLMQQIFQSAKAAGAQVDTVTILAASIEVIANLSEMLAAVGVIDKKEIPSFAADVAKLGVAQHNAKAGAPGAAVGAGAAVPVVAKAAQTGALNTPPAGGSGFLGSM